MMPTDMIDIDSKLALFDDHWSPRIVAELNGQQVKLAKFKGRSTGMPMPVKTRCFSCFADPSPWSSGTDRRRSVPVR